MTVTGNELYALYNKPNLLDKSRKYSEVSFKHEIDNVILCRTANIQANIRLFICQLDITTY